MEDIANPLLWRIFLHISEDLPPWLDPVNTSGTLQSLWQLKQKASQVIDTLIEKHCLSWNMPWDPCFLLTSSNTICSTRWLWRKGEGRTLLNRVRPEIFFNLKNWLISSESLSTKFNYPKSWDKKGPSLKANTHPQSISAGVCFCLSEEFLPQDLWNRVGRGIGADRKWCSQMPEVLVSE